MMSALPHPVIVLELAFLLCVILVRENRGRGVRVDFGKIPRFVLRSLRSVG